MTQQSKAKKATHSLLKQMRNWHTQLGVYLAVLVMLVSLTGIYLNHKGLFEREDDKASAGRLRTDTQMSTLQISFTDALTTAREVWGDRSLEHIQLKDERGTLVYKIKAENDNEIIVDATTGEVAHKKAYKVVDYASVGIPGKHGYNWNKIIGDLHTGKILGGFGKLVIDLTAFTFIVLTVSGVYLWYRPKQLKKWKAEQKAKALSQPQPKPEKVGF